MYKRSYKRLKVYLSLKIHVIEILFNEFYQIAFIKLHFRDEKLTNLSEFHCCNDRAEQLWWICGIVYVIGCHSGCAEVL